MLGTWQTSLHSGSIRIGRHWGLGIRLLAAISLNLVATPAWAGPPNQSSLNPIAVTREDFETLTFGRLIARFQSDSKISISGDDVRVPLIEELRRLGYPALGAESLVFGQDKSNEARLELGGSITELVCSNLYGTAFGCRTAVNWELYDRKRRVVIYKVLTRATAAGGSSADMGHVLVAGAFRSLLSRTRFVDSVRKPKESTGTNPQPVLNFRSCSEVARKMPNEAEQVLDGVVVVEVGNSLGSGVLLSPDGLVLTAAHVVDTEVEISILGRGGGQTRAHVARFNRQVDVALLAPEGPTDTSCLPTRSTSISVGEDLYAVGSPASRDLSFTLTRGIVSGTRQIEGVPLIQTDASISPGNSGGPLLDGKGQVVGIVSWKLAGKAIEGIAFGVPIGTALAALGLAAGTENDPFLFKIHEARRQPLEPVVDSPDLLVVPAPWVRQPVGRTSQTETSVGRGGLMWPSIITAGVGAATVLFTWSRYEAQKDPGMKQGDFDTLRVMNDVGWVAVGLGAAGFAASYLLFPGPSDKPKSSARVHLNAGVQGLSVRGSY